MMFALNDMITKGEFEEGVSIIAIHTGGLQGIDGMQKNVDKLLS